MLTVLAGTAEEGFSVRILFERQAGVPGFKLEEALGNCPRRVRAAACEGVLRGFLTTQNGRGMIAFLEARGAEEWPWLDQIAMPPDILCTPRMASELYESGAMLPKNLRNYFRSLAASVEPVKYLEQLRRENGIDDGDIFALGNGLEKVTDPAQITAALATLAADKTVKGRAMQWQLFCRLIRAGMAANHPQMEALLSSVPEGRLKDAGINAAALNLANGPAASVTRFFARGTAEATWVKIEFTKNVAGRNPKLARQIAPSLGSEDRAVLEKYFREANGENL